MAATNDGTETDYNGTVQPEQQRSKVLFYTCPDLEPDLSPAAHSNCSDCVSDDWSSIEDGDSPRTSREAQEAEIEDKYRSALNFLQEGNVERAVSIFSALLIHPIMSKYHVSDWSAFDWKKAMTDTQKIVPNMLKLFFNINLAMTGLAKDPFQFYLQALSVRPDFKDLWFNCGQCAIRRRDWRSAGFCMAQCDDEFRALEALLLIHYFNRDYLECISVLQRVFAVYPEHPTGHVIRRLILESSPFWAEFQSKYFSNSIIEFNVDDWRQKEILRKLHQFQQEGFRLDDNLFEMFPPISPTPKWAPLMIKLQPETKLEELAKLLCNIFDRISEYSTFSEQRVIFEFESLSDRCVHQPNQNSLDDQVEVTEEQLGVPIGVQPFSEIGDQMVEQLLHVDDNMQQPSVSDELTATNSDGFVDNILYQFAGSLGDGQHLVNGTEKEMEEGQQQQPITTDIPDEPHNPQEITETLNYDDQRVSQGAEAMPEFSDEISLRRSTRFFDDLNYFANSTKQRQTPAPNHQMNFLTLMGFDEQKLEEQQILTSDHQRSMQFVPDTISAPQQLPGVDELIAKLVDESLIESTKYPDILNSFLTWMAFDQHHFVILGLEQVEAFREVYARWSSLFCLSNCSFTASDLAIHQLSAELGSHRALSILQAFYGRQLLQLQKEASFAHTANANDIWDSSSAQCHGNFHETIHQNEQTSADNISDENNLFRWVFERIQSEQRRRTIEDDTVTGILVDRDENVRNLVHSKQPIDNSNELITFKQLEVRYRWLIANLLPDEIGLPNSEVYHFINTYTQLSLALELMEPEWILLSHAEFDISCLTVRNLKEMLRKRVRQFQLQHIDYLTEAKRYDELRNVLLHQYDWMSDSDDAHIKQKFLMIQCIRETDNSLADIGKWISKILSDICYNRISAASIFAKRSLRRCLHLLDELFPLDRFERNPSAEQFFVSVGRYLGQLLVQHQTASHEKLAQCTDLWRWCYRIAKFRQNELTCVELKKFYESCSNDSVLLNRRLPTKTTLLLAKGHEVLGKAKKCSRNEGVYLRLLIDEFLRVSRDPSVRSVLVSDEYADIRENMASEIMQCLRCCLSDKFAPTRVRSNRMVDHGSKLQWPMDWEFAAKVLELILPQKLPDICSDRRVPSDLIDLLIRAFEQLLVVDEAKLRCLDEILQNPFRLELDEKFDSDGLCCGYEERLHMSEEGQTRFKQLTTTMHGEQEGHHANPEFFAKCIYLLAHYHYRTVTSSGADCEGGWLRKCLAIGGSHLPTNILASAWYALGRSLTYDYAIKSDEELLDRMDAYVFPFKMALFLHWEFAESHLDVGTIIYQLRTRFARFRAQKDVSKELRCKAQKKIEGMLLKCKVHFCMALRFNDSPKDIAWLSNYFLAKIAEKLGDRPEKVLNLYYRCAIALEEEGVQYLGKINKVKQTYFEPLEVHYKVHAYTLRYLRALNAPSFPPRTSAQCSADMATIYAFLSLFRHHGVQRRSLEDGHWSETEFYEKPNLQLAAITPQQIREEQHHQLSQGQQDVLGDMAVGILSVNTTDEGQVEGVVHSLVHAVDMHLAIVRMCRTAFDVILQRFPHYKAFYRVARGFFDEKNFTRATDILFDKLFLTGRKQKCNNFLENIVEIKRTDFERNGSFPYHLFKIVKLAAVASLKCANTGRLKDLVVALTAYKASSSSREILGEPMIRELLTLVLRCFKNLAEKQQALYGHDIQHLGKLIEHLEGVIGRLKRDGRCQKERSELETMLIACIQRRDKMSQQANNGTDTELSSSYTKQQPNTTPHIQQRPLSLLHQQQLQRNALMAQLPIGLKSPTVNNNQPQQQSQQQMQNHPLSTLFQQLPDQFKMVSSASAPSSHTTSPISTLIYHQQQNKTPPHNQRLKPLDSDGFKMLQQILPILCLDRLGVVERLNIIQTLFERLGYEFPREKAAEIFRKMQSPVQQQRQQIPSSTNEASTSAVKGSLLPTKPGEPQRMTGMPPSMRSKCKIKLDTWMEHPKTVQQQQQEHKDTHQQLNAHPSSVSQLAHNQPNSLEKIGAVSNTGNQQTHFVVSSCVRADTVTPKRQQQLGPGSTNGRTQIGSSATTTLDDGPPSKIRRKDEEGPLVTNQGSTYAFSTKQPTKDVVITLHDEDIIPLTTNAPQIPKAKQKVLDSLRQKEQIQKQTIDRTRPSDIPLARKGGVPSSNDRFSMPSPASTSYSTPSVATHPVDPLAGWSRSTLYSMLATLSLQLNSQQQQNQLQPQQQQQSPQNQHQSLQAHPLMPSCSSPATPVSHRRQQSVVVQQHSQNQQQQIGGTPQTTPLRHTNEQQSPELLLSHFMNLHRIEQLRRHLTGEPFAPNNWHKNGGNPRNN